MEFKSRLGQLFFLFISLSAYYKRPKVQKKKPNVIRKLVSQPMRDGRQIFENKVVKPNNGPSAVLVLNGTSHNVIQDAIGFSVFGLAGFPTGFLVDWWKRCSSPPKNYFGGRGSSKILYCGHYCGSSAPNILGTEEPLILCTQNGHTLTADYYWILCPLKNLSSQKPLLDHAASPMVKIFILLYWDHN